MWGTKTGTLMCSDIIISTVVSLGEFSYKAGTIIWTSWQQHDEATGWYCKKDSRMGSLVGGWELDGKR